MNIRSVRAGALALLPCLVLACGGDADAAPADGDEGTVTVQPNGDVPTDTGEAAEEYVEGLESLLELAKQVDDAESAREVAPEFRQTSMRLEALGESIADGGNVAAAMAMANRSQEIARVGQELSMEMMRISTDPALREPFSEALFAFQEVNR